MKLIQWAEAILTLKGAREEGIDDTADMAAHLLAEGRLPNETRTVFSATVGRGGEGA